MSPQGAPPLIRDRESTAHRRRWPVILATTVTIVIALDAGFAGLVATFFRSASSTFTSCFCAILGSPTVALTFLMLVTPMVWVVAKVAVPKEYNKRGQLGRFAEAMLNYCPTGLVVRAAVLNNKSRRGRANAGRIGWSKSVLREIHRI